MTGGLGDSSQDRLFCPDCAPDQGKGYTLSDLQKWREENQVHRARYQQSLMDKLGPDVYFHVQGPGLHRGGSVVSVGGSGQQPTREVREWRFNLKKAEAMHAMFNDAATASWVEIARWCLGIAEQRAEVGRG